ncbi:MAG TPA: 50S ribosomal protein L30 [Terriglobia bacterium]|nr:50S ribosomal protein L30 [Terriglobia bacterium]
MTEQAQKTIHIKYVRSGIGFDFHTKQMIRCLGLRRLHQVVERQNTPQIRGLVAKIPHFVEIVKLQPAPAWMSTPEYAIHLPEAKPVRERLPRGGGDLEVGAVHEPAAAVHKTHAPAHEKTAKRAAHEAGAHADAAKHKKTAKTAEPAKHAAHAGKEKAKAAKAETPKKKGTKAKDAKDAKLDKKGKK